jgi:ABC-type glycerol-3-phosphate transport system permease component
MAVVQPTDLTVQVAQRAAKRAEIGDRVGKSIVLFMLFSGVILFLVPFYLMMAISLKSQQELAATSLWSWPQRVTFENYQVVLTNPNVSFPMFLQNSLTISTLSTLGVLFSSSLVAYAFARMEFAGRDRLFIVLLSTMMLPGVVTMIPTYVMFAQVGWVNTNYPLWVPAWFGGGAFNIFLLRQFYLGLPRELDEAAVLDGAGHWTVFWRVILPLSGPALATVGIFAFIYNWRDFMGPLLYLNDPNLQTLEIGLRTYNALQQGKTHLVITGAVLVMIPLLILFFIGQRWFVKGIVMTGGK